MWKFKRILLFLLLLLYPSGVRAAFTEIIPVSSYGWLDQYSLNTQHNFIGNEACVPTTSTNALTYFQNVVPQVFGNTLSGTTYPEWEATADYLIGVMGTTVGSGTEYDQFVYAIHDYITVTKGFPEVQFSGMFPNNNWSTTYPKPSYITSGVPSISFLANAIAAGSAVLTSIEYSNGDGHEILINGLTWDSITETGTVYFVDPLDPSQNYSPAVPLGPVKQTEGELFSNGTRLVLRYPQYDGTLPYTGTYQEAQASLYGVLSIGSAPFVPFSTLLTGNSRSIAEGFDRIDPTTSAMFPVMAVLNTSVDIEGAFAQLDPSVFNDLLYTALTTVEIVREAVTDHLLSYHMPCGCPNDSGCFRIWCTPFDVQLSQEGSCNYTEYKSTVQGIATGIDYPIYDSFIAGAAFSYSKSNLNWRSTSAEGNLQNYSGILYGMWKKLPYWFEACLGYTYDHVRARRNLSFVSTIPFVEPINATLSHKEHIQTFLGHFGVGYDIYRRSYGDLNMVLWPYLNLDYIEASRPSFTENGSPVFAQTVSRKRSGLVFSELGLGGSVCRPFCCKYNSFLNATLSYVGKAYIGGKGTDAYFNGQPESAFTVSGLSPESNFFRTSIILGVKDPSDTFHLHIGYQGNFSSCYSANEVSAELSLLF